MTRVDQWLTAVRLVKTRSLATEACRAGHVRIDGERVKPAHPVAVGATVRVLVGKVERIVVVRRLIEKRVGAAIAAECFDDLTRSRPPQEERAVIGVRDRGTGRPTKRERRALDRLQGR